MSRDTNTFVATCALGLEPLLSKELLLFGGEEVSAKTGALHFLALSAFKIPTRTIFGRGQFNALIKNAVLYLKRTGCGNHFCDLLQFRGCDNFLFYIIVSPSG